MSATNLPPELPVEHLHATADLSPDVTMFADRRMRELKPDMILLYTGARPLSVLVDLSPAMIVHLANELLTDGERAHIRRAEELSDA